jgi:plastocyanin
MSSSRKRAVTIIVAAAAFWLADAAPSRAQNGKPRASGRPPTAAEFDALKRRVEEQNEAIMRLTQLELLHYQHLLGILRNEKPGAGNVTIPGGAPAQGGTGPAPGTTTAIGSVVEPPPVHAKAATAAITGRVDVKGKPWGPIYVYVDNLKDPLAAGTAEIAQRDRAFVPNVLVVARGTNVLFPNADPFLHNVFSPGPKPFDLGAVKQGEKPGSVRLFNTGVVEVLCNMHAKMRANILVVPNRHYTKVGGDGSFRLENVPVGARQVVAWTPDAKPMTQSVALSPAGASIGFALQMEASPPPIDKMGKPRAPYRSDE